MSVQHGPSWELVPDSICTSNRQAPTGPTIHIPAGVRELAIGRGVKGEGCLPHWPQISTYHCKIWMSSEDQTLWYLEDQSTNGSCVNGERVPKGTSRPLQDGDRIKLAALTEDAEKIVQYVFTRVTGSSTASPNQGSATKKRPLEHGGPSNGPSKRLSPAQPAAAAPVDAGILQKLRKSNEDLRKQLKEERLATQAARGEAQDARAQLQVQQGAAAQSADSALAEAKAEFEKLKAEKGAAEAQLDSMQRDAESLSDEVTRAEAKLQALQKDIQQLQDGKEDLVRKLKVTTGDFQRAQKERQRHEDAQKLAEEHKEAALKDKQAAEQARSSAQNAQQEAEKSLHAARQELQEVEDARGAAEEKAACLEAMLQQSASNLAQIREAKVKQNAAAKNIAAAFNEAVEKHLAEGSQELCLLDSWQQQIAAGMAESSVNTQGTLLASPVRSLRQNGYAHEAAGTQQASPVRSIRQNGHTEAAGTQQEHTKLKGTSSEVTHPQRSSSKSVTSQPAEAIHRSEGADTAKQAKLVDQVTLPAADLEEKMDNIERELGEEEEPTASEWRTKLHQIAEASAECNGNDNTASEQQQVQFGKHLFKDGQGTLETPSLFPGSNQQPPSLAQHHTATGTEEKLQAKHAQTGSQGGSAGHNAEHANGVTNGSPTSDRENIPMNHSAPYSQSQGKPPHVASAEENGESLRLSLQGAGGQKSPRAHEQEWDDME